MWFPRSLFDFYRKMRNSRNSANRRNNHEFHPQLYQLVPVSIIALFFCVISSTESLPVPPVSPSTSVSNTTVTVQVNNKTAEANGTTVNDKNNSTANNQSSDVNRNITIGVVSLLVFVTIVSTCSCDCSTALFYSYKEPVKRLFDFPDDKAIDLNNQNKKTYYVE